MPIAFEILDGAWIFLGVVILMTIGVIYGFFTEKGSGIAARPYNKVYSGQAGARGKSAGGAGRDERVSQHHWSKGTK